MGREDKDAVKLLSGEESKPKIILFVAYHLIHKMFTARKKVGGTYFK